MFRYRYSETVSSRLPEPDAVDQDLLELLRSNIISKPIESPFGGKLPVVYADHTASGQGLRFVEDYVSNEVLSVYGNTHSLSTSTARFSTMLRAEAREIIRNYFNAGPEYAVIFAGNGATGAIAKFVSIFIKSNGFSKSTECIEQDRWGAYRCSVCDVRLKNDAAVNAHLHTETHLRKVGISDNSTVLPSTRPPLLIIIDPRAHHSLLLPFREIQSNSSLPFELVIVSLPEEVSDLRALLSERGNSSTVSCIALLSVASNVTGEVRNVYEISKLVREYGGLVAWDAAAVGGHFRLDVSPASDSLSSADFVFLSPHKLLGGVGASGVLLAKRCLLKNPIPGTVGGGVVFFVSDRGHSYIRNEEEREEAGTPNIVADIRAGLAFHVQHKISNSLNINDIEENMKKRFLERVGHKLIVLCSKSSSVTSSSNDLPSSVAIVSFNVPYVSGILLHSNFVVAVLNDVFGIQARGGCACAGPFAQRLLNIEGRPTELIETALERSGLDILRPAFVRVGFHYSMTEVEVGWICDAVDWVATNGWKLLRGYTVDVVTGEWRKRGGDLAKGRVWISNLFAKSRPADHSTDTLTVAELGANAIASCERTPIDQIPDTKFSYEYASLVWFALPTDYRCSALNGSAPVLDERVLRTPLGPTLGLSNVELSQSEGQGPIVVDAVPNGLIEVKRKKGLLEVPRKLRATVATALGDFEMIRPGDRVLIGLSGGKDSLALLHILRAIQRKAPFKFEIAAATVDPMTPEYQPEPLIAYMAELGVTYHMLREPIMELAKTHMDPKNVSICSFCSRMKRGLLYKCMRDNNYSVLALGQHLDDLAESFLMSAFRNSILRTMKAHYTVETGDLRVIRPLIYVRERQTEAFAKAAGLPIIRDNCPACFAAPKERRRIKMLLSEEEHANEGVFASLVKCMRPLMARNVARDDADDEEGDYNAEEALQPCADGVCPINRK